jgi:hypothetical protein
VSCVKHGHEVVVQLAPCAVVEDHVLMSTEDQEGASGKPIDYRVEDPAAITDDAHAALREGVELILAARLNREQLEDLATSLQQVTSQGASVEDSPAVQSIAGLKDWAKRNPAIFGVLVMVIGVLAQFGLELLADSAVTPVEEDISEEVPRPSEDELSRMIDEQIRQAREAPSSDEQPNG